MPQLTVPPSVSQNIARARSLILRNDVLRSLQCMIRALEVFTPTLVVGKARYEVESNIRQCVADINLNPRIRDLLAELTRSPGTQIPYAPGGETKLLTVLHMLRKALENMEQTEQRGAQDAREQRKAELFENGRRLLAAGESVKAKVELRRLAAEFGKEPDILAQAGAMLMNADMPADAAEFLELAVETFPKEGLLYGTLVECYMSMREYEKAEAVYLKVLKQFGSHPRTLVNLAKLYKLMNKRQKAVEMAQRAVAQEPDNAEALEIANAIR